MFSKKKKEVNEEYFKEGVVSVSEGDVELAAESQEEVADKIINSGMLKKYTEIGKLMYAMLNDYRKFLYILNPLDVVPDFIPGLGYIDDFAIITFAIRFIESDIHKYLDFKLDETA